MARRAHKNHHRKAIDDIQRRNLVYQRWVRRGGAAGRSHSAASLGGYGLLTLEPLLRGPSLAVRLLSSCFRLPTAKEKRPTGQVGFSSTEPCKEAPASLSTADVAPPNIGKATPNVIALFTVCRTRFERLNWKATGSTALSFCAAHSCCSAA